MLRLVFLLDCVCCAVVQLWVAANTCDDVRSDIIAITIYRIFLMDYWFMGVIVPGLMGVTTRLPDPPSTSLLLNSNVCSHFVP